MNDDKKRTNKKNIYKKADAAKKFELLKDTRAAPEIPYEPSLKKKYQQGLEQMQRAQVLDKAHLIEPQKPSKLLGYRTHAALRVRKSADPKQPFEIGAFKPKERNLIDISACPLHKESIGSIIRDIKELIPETTMQPYDSSNQTGDLKYVAIRAAHLTEEIMLTFVVSKDGFKKELRNLVKELKQREHQISTAYLNINSHNGDLIFGDESKHIAGSQRLRERISDFNFEIGPTSFFQVNPWTAESMYRRIEQLVGYGNQDVAWDLYSGIGQISLILSRAGFRVLGVEANPQSVRDAQNNVSRNFEENLPQFQPGKVEDLKDLFPTWSLNPRVIVANPPSMGLEASALEFIADKMHSLEDTDLIYMSCNAESLASDMQAFQNRGLNLKQLEAYDMFPYTEKMDWIAVIKT